MDSIDQTIAPGAEQVLEKHRPAKCQSRLSSYFAARTPEQAWVVKHGMARSKGTQLNPMIRVYQVEASGDTRCPMMLVQTIKVMIAEGAPADQIACVAAAYWTTAQRHWYFVEALAPDMLILGEVEFSTSFESAWRDVNKSYKADLPIAVHIVSDCRRLEVGLLPSNA